MALAMLAIFVTIGDQVWLIVIELEGEEIEVYYPHVICLNFHVQTQIGLIPPSPFQSNWQCGI